MVYINFSIVDGEVHETAAETIQQFQKKTWYVFLSVTSDFIIYNIVKHLPSAHDLLIVPNS